MKRFLWIKFFLSPGQNKCDSSWLGELDGLAIVDDIKKTFYNDHNVGNRHGIRSGELTMFKIKDNGSKMHLKKFENFFCVIRWWKNRWSWCWSGHEPCFVGGNSADSILMQVPCCFPFVSLATVWSNHGDSFFLLFNNVSFGKQKAVNVSLRWHTLLSLSLKQTERQIH